MELWLGFGIKIGVWVSDGARVMVRVRVRVRLG